LPSVAIFPRISDSPKHKFNWCRSSLLVISCEPTLVNRGIATGEDPSWSKSLQIACFIDNSLALASFWGARLLQGQGEAIALQDHIQNLQDRVHSLKTCRDWPSGSRSIPISLSKMIDHGFVRGRTTLYLPQSLY
jgi:hypothetical protein